MSRRHGRIESPYVPVNPRYVQHWFGAVSVADAIESTFRRTMDRALHYATRNGEVSIIVPMHWQDCTESVKTFLNERLTNLIRLAVAFGNKYNCKIHVGNFRTTRKYIEMCQCAFHLKEFDKNVFEIPTHWDDLEKDYTWAEVCENGQYYSTSSSETWPRPEYARRAELEKIRNARVQRLDPFAKYYAAANRN